MENKRYWFFGSKLNTILLFILIILMIIAFRIMSQNKEVYFPFIVSEKEKSQQQSYGTYTFPNGPSFRYLSDSYLENLDTVDKSLALRISNDNGSSTVWMIDNKYSESLYYAAALKKGTVNDREGVVKYIQSKKFGSNTFDIFESCGEDHCGEVSIFQGSNNNALVIEQFGGGTIIDLASVKF